MFTELSYCGSAPLPGELLMRFNLDPVLIAALILAAGLQLWVARRLPTSQLVCALAGWIVAAVAFLSPLCALSVALFSARVAQHMILALIAAPLIAIGMPSQKPAEEWLLWLSGLAFFASLWFWHMPLPYEATFRSVIIYWCMHLCLFGSSLWLWYALLHHARAHTVEVFVVGTLTSIQMGLLGALLSLAHHALFRWHLLTTWAWHLTPLEDQQLGGVLMWVPGILIFLWVAVYSLGRLWVSLGGVRAA